MNKGREIGSYDYVNDPYERVRDPLAKTHSPCSRWQQRQLLPGRNRAAELHVDFGGMGVKTDIKIFVRDVEEKVVDAASTPTTRLLLEWEAAVVPAHEGRAFYLSADLHGNAVGFFWRLRTTLRGRGEEDERDRRAPHRGGVGTSLR